MVQQINTGNRSFWFDNWTGKGMIWPINSEDRRSPKVMVNQFITNGQWDTYKLSDIISPDIIHHIMNITIWNPNEEDQIIWN